MSVSTTRQTGRLAVTRFGLRALSLGLMVVLVGYQPPTPHAQDLSFEVASLRPTNGEGVNFGGVRVLPGGTVMADDISLRSLIFFAYGLDPVFEFVEGPADQLDREFDLVAKSGVELGSAGTTGALGPANIMMQRLLAERFNLVVRTDHRDETGYSLVTVKSAKDPGPRVRPSAPCQNRPAVDGKKPSCMIRTVNNELSATGIDMGQFAQTLSTQLRRPVSNKTGLGGHFDIQLRFDQAAVMRAAGFQVPESQSDLPSLFVALQEQLGLRLEAERVQVRTLVVERVDSFVPNP